MKLRNKKTGKIVKVNNFSGFVHLDGESMTYSSLAKLNMEWEDVPEEPKTFWAFSWAGEPEEHDEENTPQELIEAAKSMGNYFNTREEAEQAVAELKFSRTLKKKQLEFLTAVLFGGGK